MHKCPNCDSDQLNEDTTTSQLICSECGIATGIYLGITQSQTFVETKGLRVVGKLDESGQMGTYDIVDLEIPPDLTSTPAQNQSGVRPTSTLQLDTGKKQTRVQQLNNKTDYTTSFVSSEGSDADEEHSVFQPDQTRTPAQNCRPWRLSEPFTIILRRQAHELASLLELTGTRRERFLDTVWHLWLIYLSVTGELGEEAWAHASTGPIRATRTLMDLCDAKWIQRRGSTALLSYLLGPLYRGSRVKKSSQPDRDAQSRDYRLSHFMWAGWSALYEPSEGRESKDPFLKPLLTAHRAAVAKCRSTGAHRARAQKRRSASNGTGGSATANEHGDTDDSNKKSPGRRRSSHGAKKLAEDTMLEEEEEEEEQKQEEEDQKKLTHTESPDHAMSDKLLNELFDEYDGDDASTVSNWDKNSQTSSSKRKKKRPVTRESVYRNHIIQKLLLIDPWKRVFWRGQIQGRLRCLLSHNLAILFFAYLSISPVNDHVTNPITWPHSDESLLSVGQVALTSLVSLSDLYELCKEHRLTFIKAGECLPPGQFAIHDQYLFPLLHPKRPPTLSLLTRAANQMLHILGCFQLPRLPLSWLVQRHVIALGLPDVIYKVTRLLLKRLHLVLSHSAGLPTGPFLICSMPWLRVLRVEVVAMALVVIALRLLFKFDGLTEYRLACVAKLLDPDPATCPEQDAREDTHPFDWTSWAAYVVPRFSHPSFAQSEARTESILREPDVLLRCNSASGLDLACVETAQEFLGSYEFKVGESIGWGESVMYARKHGQSESKSALTKPLRDLLVDREDRQDLSAQQTPPAPNSPPVDNSKYLPELRLTQIQRDGLQSPFRHTHLNFLLDSVLPSPDQLFANSFSANLSAPERHTLTDWLEKFHKRRSSYTPICAHGLWANSGDMSSVSSRVKGTRNADDLNLPVAVKRLIRRHDRQLAELLQMIDLKDQEEENAHDNELKKEPASPTPTPQDTSTCNPATSRPSGSIHWLVQLCAIACGASNMHQLLVEIEMLEQMLFPVEAGPVRSERFRQADLALIASLDLR